MIDIDRTTPVVLAPPVTYYPNGEYHIEITMNRVATSQIPRTVSRMRGLYARVGRKAGCDASYVSRIARGERRSAKIETLLRLEFNKVLKNLKLSCWQH
jgi:hypothetical protein